MFASNENKLKQWTTTIAQDPKFKDVELPDSLREFFEGAERFRAARRLMSSPSVGVAKVMANRSTRSSGKVRIPTFASVLFSSLLDIVGLFQTRTLSKHRALGR